jgi:hypothetical protein
MGVIETMTFRLLDGTSEADFLAVDLWRSAADADACAARWDDDPVAQEFMALVDRDTVEVRRYDDLD